MKQSEKFRKSIPWVAVMCTFIACNGADKGHETGAPQEGTPFKGPSQRVPTLAENQLPKSPPPPTNLISMPTPTAISIPDIPIPATLLSNTTDSAENNRHTWLTSDFRCRAISTVRFRKCRFTRTDLGYRLSFQNDVHCSDVEFNDEGHPSKLIGCRSNWLRIPRNNTLTKAKKHPIWSGSHRGWKWKGGDTYCCPGIWLEAPTSLQIEK